MKPILQKKNYTLKFFIFVLIINCSSFHFFAQSKLPISFGFDNETLPSGWKKIGTAYYKASGNAAPALKFDDTGDQLTIQSIENIGMLSFDLAGNGFSGGIFSVEGSSSGSNWENLRIFSYFENGTYTKYTINPILNMRFLRFKYTLKVVGNVGLDNLTLEKSTAVFQQQLLLSLEKKVHHLKDTIPNPTTAGQSLEKEPGNQPKNFQFTDLKSYRFFGEFEPAENTSGYIVIQRKGNPCADQPQDGVTYQRGDQIGSSTVVSTGKSHKFVPNNIVANTEYHFAIFAYKGDGIYRNYLQKNPLIGKIKTASAMIPPNYYATISVSNPTFISDLQQLIVNHRSLPYAKYDEVMVTNFETRDTTANRKVITCAYSGDNQIFSNTFDWVKNGYSREHTYCHSWMPSHPANHPKELPEYNDLHHLFPTNQKEANQVRSNYPLGIVDSVIRTYKGCKLGKDRQGHLVFEPRDEHKGDAARALFYMAICYNTMDGKKWKLKNPISEFIPYGQEQEVLKLWHVLDPPSSWEIARNDFIDSIQGNRNPFIDHPEYAFSIDFEALKIQNSKIESLGSNLQIKSALQIETSKDGRQIQVRIKDQVISNYSVCTLTGEVLEQNKNWNRSDLKFLKKSNGKLIIKLLINKEIQLIIL